MVRGLLIGAFLLAAPCAAQTPPTQTPAADPDAPRSTGPRGDSTQPPAPESERLKPPGSRADAPPEPPKEAEPEGTVSHRQQLFISPSGEPFRAPFGDPYPVNLWFARADANGDGVITLDEFKADALRFFKVLDVNHDGVIDGFENDDYENKLVPEILPKLGGLTASDVMTRKEIAEGKAKGDRGGRGGLPFGRGGGRGGVSRNGAGQFGLLDEPQPVRGSDGNLDYRITLAEWEAAAAHRFAVLDLKKDGRLTLAELPLTPLQAQLLEREKHAKKGGR